MDYAGEGVFETLGVAAVPDLEAREDVGQVPTVREGLRDSATITHVVRSVGDGIVEEGLQIGGEVVVGAVGNVRDDRTSSAIGARGRAITGATPDRIGLATYGRGAGVAATADGLAGPWLVEPDHDETGNGVVVATLGGLGLGEPDVVGCIVVSTAGATGPLERRFGALYGTDLYPASRCHSTCWSFRQ